MISKYYFENTHLNTDYPTLWHGFLSYNGEKINISENYYQKSNRELDDLLAEICDINFYTTLIDNNIYISVCRDTKFYYYNFEKTIKKAAKRIEKKFNISIIYSEFFATEVKHLGNQYKYFLVKDDNKMILKKKTLNWDTFDNNKLKELTKDIEYIKISS